MLPRGYLIIIKHDGTDGSVYPVTTSTCSVGRGLHNDIRFRVQSVSEDHCVICASEFQPALLRNISNSNPTEVNNVPVHESERVLEHGDIITTGERSLRWEYHPQSRYYVSSNSKGTAPLSASPLPESTGMVGVPISVLQSTLGSQPFSGQSVVITERKVKFSPALVAADSQSPASGDGSIAPSKLVAVVSPQRRPQSEKKAAEATYVSTPVVTSVTATRNQSSAESVDITSSNRKSSRLYSKSARKSTGSDGGVKTLQHKRSLQALVTTRKTRKSVGTPQRSRIPRFMYDFKRSRTGMSQSSKKVSSPSGSFKKMAAVSSVRKAVSEQKLPLPARAEERKRTLESGLRSAARAAKRLKLESPKTPDKKKMAALLVCHGKMSRPKTPQLVSDVPHEVSHTSAVKSMRKSMTPASSHRVAVQKSARKKYEKVQTSVGDETPSSKRAYSMEIPAHFNFSSGTVDLNVASDEQHPVKEKSMRLSQNIRRSSSLKTELTVSPGLQEASDSHGVNKHVSPAKVTSRKKTQPSPSNAVHSPAAVCPTDRHSPTVSADHTHDTAQLKIIASSAKKMPKRDMRKSLFRQLMNKSVQSTSAFSIEKDAKISEPLLSTPHTQRKARSMTAISPVATFQTTGLYSSRKSGRLSEKLSPKSERNSPHTKKCSSSPEIQQNARLVSPSSIPVHKERTSRKTLRFSTLGVQHPESVELSSGSQQTEGKEGSIAPSTSTSKLTASVKKSRTPRETQAAKSDESGSESTRRTGYKGRPVFSSTPASKQSASTVKSRDAGGVGSSSKSVDQNSTPLGVRTLSVSPSRKDNEMVCSVGPVIIHLSPRISNSVGNLSSELHEEGPDSSGSRYLEYLYMLKSSGKRANRLSRSEASLNSYSPMTSLSAQGAGILHKRSSLKEQVPQSDAYRTYLTPSSSQNTTFDFDSVETPSRTLDDLVSPLTSNRKRKSLRWQDASTSKEKRKSEPVFKKRRISERIGRNVTSSGSSSLHSLPPHFFTSLIDESVDTSPPEGQEQVSYNFSFSDRVKTQSSSGSASPKFRGMQKLMQKVPRILKTPKIDRTSVSGGRQLMKTSSGVKSANDTSVVHGSMKLITTPTTRKLKTDSVDRTKPVKAQKTPKSPKKNLSDIPGVMQLRRTPRDLRSPRNDLRNISGVKRLMKTPESPNSPNNDLRDVRGIKQLMMTPKSPKSPKSLLRDTHGVRKLTATLKRLQSPNNDLKDVSGMRKRTATPKSLKSPKNDLRDVHGVRKIMTTPKSLQSPNSDLKDVSGVRKLTATPKSPKSPNNDLKDVSVVRKLMATPKSPKSPKNDLRDVRGVRKLMTTPKSPKSPKNDLRDVRGVRKLMKTPKSPKSPKNDLRDVRGVKKLMTTPKSPKSPKNDLRDVRGVKKLMTTPKSPKSPKNDLRDVRGVRKLMATPKSPKSPKNDLSDVRGVRKLMTTPKSPKSPKNDLRDIHGVKRLMKTPRIQKSPKNDLRDVHGVKSLMASPKGMKSPVNDLTVTDVRKLTPQVKKLPPQSPEFGGHSSLAESTQKSPQSLLPSAVAGTRCTRHGTSFSNKVPGADISTEMDVDQRTVPVPKDIKRSNTRSMRSRKEPNLGILQAADVSPKSRVKKPRQRKNEKTGITEHVSPGRSLEISPGHIVTSVTPRHVHFDIPNSLSTPGDEVTRGNNIATSVEVVSPSRNRRTAKSKGSIKTEESAAQKDTDHLAVSFPSVRTRRGRQLTSASEISSSPTTRKRGARVSADAEVSSLPKEKQGITATAPVRSKRQQNNTANVSVEELSPRKRRGGTANTGSPKRLATLTEDTGDMASSAALTSRRRRGAAVVTEVEILQLPVTKKTRGKLAVRSTAAATASDMPSEDLFSTSDKQPREIDSPSPPGKRRQRGTKPVEPSSPLPARKLRGTKLSVVGEEEKVSSDTRTRNKPRITSSPVSKAKSPLPVSRRGGTKTAKKEVSPQLTTGRQTRATSRRKK